MPIHIDSIVFPVETSADKTFLFIPGAQGTKSLGVDTEDYDDFFDEHPPTKYYARYTLDKNGKYLVVSSEWGGTLLMAVQYKPKPESFPSVRYPLEFPCCPLPKSWKGKRVRREVVLDF